VLQTDSSSFRTSVSMTTVLKDRDRLCSETMSRICMSSVFAAFSCSHLAPHQSATSAIQCCKHCIMNCTCDCGAEMYVCVISIAVVLRCTVSKDIVDVFSVGNIWFRTLNQALQYSATQRDAGQLSTDLHDLRSIRKE